MTHLYLKLNIVMLVSCRINFQYNIPYYRTIISKVRCIIFVYESPMTTNAVKSLTAESMCVYHHIIAQNSKKDLSSAYNFSAGESFSSKYWVYWLRTQLQTVGEGRGGCVSLFITGLSSPPARPQRPNDNHAFIINKVPLFCIVSRYSIPQE